MQYILPLYLLLINAAGFTIMYMDKNYARKNRWRIPEATLLAVSFLGGSLGSLLGMYVFRHKTKHWKFRILVPLSLLLHLALLWIAVTSGMLSL